MDNPRTPRPGYANAAWRAQLGSNRAELRIKTISDVT